MIKKIVGLLGAVAGLASLGTAQAAINPAANAPQESQASSYADLLQPIPNAAAQLKADDAARAQRTTGGLQLAQYYYGYAPPWWYFYRHRHHHHHHHHHHSRY